ncbi:MAG: 4-phosphoerythronate dehydrogenase [Gammaproteobacteria bacterium]
MRIVADENMPGVREACESLCEPKGEVVTLPGREIGPEDVRAADCLLVRSVTPVSAALLEGSAVRFVGSATIGVDHVDLPWLHARGIDFQSAPGCNATAAAQWVLRVVLELLQRRGLDTCDMVVGIVGLGNVGSRVKALFEALGVRCLVNDPPRAMEEGDDGYVELEELLQRSDVITVHVPLERRNRWPTFHLIDERFLGLCRNGALVINASRGAVADTSALLRHAWRTEMVVDTWEGEPHVHLGLLDQVSLASPHVAGYSLEGRYRGTETVYRALCAHLGREATWSPWSSLPAVEPVDVTAAAREGGACAAVLAAARAVSDPWADHRRMMGLRQLTIAAQGAYFDGLRRQYPLRREFEYVPVCRTGVEEADAALAAVGFPIH